MTKLELWDHSWDLLAEHELTATQHHVLLYLLKQASPDGSIPRHRQPKSLHELADRLNRGRNTVQRALDTMPLGLVFIERRGSSRRFHYVLCCDAKVEQLELGRHGSSLQVVGGGPGRREFLEVRDQISSPAARSHNGTAG